MLTALESGRQLTTKRCKPRSSPRGRGCRSLWSFLKPAEPVSSLSELDNSDPLIQAIAPERAIGSVKRIIPEDFYQQYRIPGIPVIIRGIANGWGAGTKWKDPHYFSNLYGRSHVPIEVGGHYLDVNWTQKMVSFKDFIEQYITLENKYVNGRFLFACGRLCVLTSSIAILPIPSLQIKRRRGYRKP